MNPEDIDMCIDFYGKEKEVCSAEFQDIVNIVKTDVRVSLHSYEALRLFTDLYDILEGHL